MSELKLTGGIKFFYGLGAAPYGIKDNGFSYFLLIFYSQVLGLSPVLTSLALSIAIVVDAITDPLIGYVSDNWRSKWGRRHPFMYLSILPICAAYALMWNPPDMVMQSQTSMFVFLVVMTVSIRIFLTFPLPCLVRRGKSAPVPVRQSGFIRALGAAGTVQVQ